jgi:hypothetical protein
MASSIRESRILNSVIGSIGVFIMFSLNDAYSEVVDAVGELLLASRAAFVLANRFGESAASTKYGNVRTVSDNPLRQADTTTKHLSSRLVDRGNGQR